MIPETSSTAGGHSLSPRYAEDSSGGAQTSMFPGVSPATGVADDCTPVPAVSVAPAGSGSEPSSGTTPRQVAGSYHDSIACQLRAVALELRDHLEAKPEFVCAQSVDLGGVLYTYARGEGLTVEFVNGRKLGVPEEALDLHGLVVADDAAASGAKQAGPMGEGC